MRPYPTKPFAFFWHYIRFYRKLFFVILFLLFVRLFLQKADPYLFSKVVDTLVASQGNRTDIWIHIGWLVVGMGVLNLTSNGIRRFNFYLMQKIEPDMGVRIKRDMTEYILGHSVGFLNNQLSGKVAARVDQLSDKTITMFWNILFGFYYPSLDMLITISLLLSVNWGFALLFVFWMGLLFCVLLISSKRIQKCSETRAEKSTTSSGTIVDMICNSVLVKSFANTSFEKRMLEPKLAEEKKAAENMFRTMENNKTIQFLIIEAFHITTICWAVFLWQKDIITAGSIVFVLMLTANVRMLFNNFVHQLLEWHKTLGIISNALLVVSIPHQIKDKENASDLKVKKGKIEFKNMTFSYHENKPVFKDFSLTVKAGERVGLVGVSGSGKSTLINVLQRFYEVENGSVLIDGQDIKEVTQESLHQNISMIPQDTALFHRSLFENIHYGNPEASEKEVISASKKAYAHQFITALKNGYDSLVGDRGVKLSGGQRQRIAIARALLKKAPVLILDEATSALDSESELCVQENIQKLMKGRTVIAIAHRLSTLRSMDRIIVLSKGKIVEEGTPEELLAKKGKYARLWKLQTQVKGKNDAETSKTI